MARRAVSAARPPTRSARGRPTAHAPGGRPARRHYYRRRQTTDDRRQRAKQHVLKVLFSLFYIYVRLRCNRYLQKMYFPPYVMT